MGRRTYVSVDSLSLVNPHYTELITARTNAYESEVSFYQARTNELNRYRGLGGLSRQTVEAAYDSLLGSDPWNYYSKFENTSRVTPRETDDSVNDFDVDLDSFYVLVPRASSDLDEYIFFNPGTGSPSVDLLYTNISFFTSFGGTGSFEDPDDEDRRIPYKQGFGEVPTAYRNNSQYDGRVIHMLGLIGYAYEQAVIPFWDTYEDKLNRYRSFQGSTSSNSGDFFSGSPELPYNGYQGTNAGYNRPGNLSPKLVNETRGL